MTSDSCDGQEKLKKNEDENRNKSMGSYIRVSRMPLFWRRRLADDVW